MFIFPRDSKGKSVNDSALRNAPIEIFSDHHHPHGLIYGGRILHIVSQYANQVAHDHAELECENIGIDFVRFFSTVKKDDRVICLASINRVWGSILEVGAKVLAEDLRSLEERKVLSAYFIFQSKDEEVSEIVPVIPVTKEEKRRHMQAEKRRQLRNKNANAPFYAKL